MADEFKSAAPVEGSTGAADRRLPGRRSRITIDIYRVGASGSTHVRSVSALNGPGWPPPLAPVDWPDCACPRHVGGSDRTGEAARAGEIG